MRRTARILVLRVATNSLAWFRTFPKTPLMLRHFHAFLVFLVTAVLALTITAVEERGTRIVSENGYSGCVELSNAVTRVVLEPNLGGRVLRFQFHGVEALYQDPTHNGRVYDPANMAGMHPPGGRFDIGPEFTVPPHPLLFLGKWKSEITGDRSARMTSVEDAATGVQLIREFSLDATQPRLICTQTVVNVSKTAVRYCYWGRTFADDGGICLVPLNPKSRYPLGYAIYAAGDIMNFRPAAEANVRVRDGLLEVIGKPARPKFAIDSTEGWLAHLARNNLLFVKTFPAYPDRVYGELGGNTVALYYREAMTELEPIGPMEEIAPGGRARFSEIWTLHDFPFPADRTADLAKVRDLVRKDFDARLSSAEAK